ncbi:aminotransferase class III-fold pyridoxal phosphate-dependent enzyme [Rhizobium sp. CG5]|uniref:aminotransferase class III-fold pyridoxal phosphate-dependent enzyme n=1 Tax=Rhizobium sp. CG5 TaxID=2726076 RepID=UPI002033858C|nr:aminotransferase class III-fold pyridoxal phosphate-dependent enzyme [Rhizobium sp. CG5]MCM2476361.1 aminotransferase class III-fold pyridoxal phosphate-dependent enzyme [Rhizobium sp. CG5]
MRTNSKNSELRERARKVIPGGMYGHESVALLPPDFPQFFSKAEGARLWDADGNAYVDYMCAFGPNLLGYKHPQVEAAARAQADLGDTMTGPSEFMVRLAEDFVGMIEHADWAMFCKNGSDATSMAMVISRAHTGRRKILVAKGTYHGASPWNTPVQKGILPEDRAHIVYFAYNDLDSLRDAVKSADGDVAAVFATPFRHEVFHDQTKPLDVYAKGVRQICDEVGALLVVDEIRTGFRLSRDCSWAQFGVKPDLSSWGKVLANGYPLSALLGAEKIRAAAQTIFVTGSFWFSAVPMAAGVETLRLIRETDYLERMVAIADRLRTGIAEQALHHGIGIRQTGPSQMPLILFDDDPDMRYGYFWTAAAVRRGVYLHPYHNMFITSALTEDDIEKTLDVTNAAFEELKRSYSSIEPQSNPFVAARLNASAAA